MYARSRARPPVIIPRAKTATTAPVVKDENDPNAANQSDARGDKKGI